MFYFAGMSMVKFKKKKILLHIPAQSPQLFYIMESQEVMPTTE